MRLRTILRNRTSAVPESYDVAVSAPADPVRMRRIAGCLRKKVLRQSAVRQLASR